jgi:MFS family permease
MAGAFAGFPVYMTWQPRFEALTSQGPWLLGWIMALLNLGALAGSALLPRLLRRFAREVVLAGASVWRASMLGLAAAATTVSPMTAGLVLQEVASGLSDPVTAAWTNEHIAAEQRATALSVRSTFFTLGGALGLVTLGLLARSQGIPVAWGVAAALFALTALGCLGLGRVAARVRAHGAPPPPLGPLPAVESVESMAAKEGVAAGVPRA